MLGTFFAIDNISNCRSRYDANGDGRDGCSDPSMPSYAHASCTRIVVWKECAVAPDRTTATRHATAEELYAFSIQKATLGEKNCLGELVGRELESEFFGAENRSMMIAKFRTEDSHVLRAMCVARKDLSQCGQIDLQPTAL
jgi:hypothetical protein